MSEPRQITDDHSARTAAVWLASATLAHSLGVPTGDETPSPSTIALHAQRLVDFLAHRLAGDAVTITLPVRPGGYRVLGYNDDVADLGACWLDMRTGSRGEPVVLDTRKHLPAGVERASFAVIDFHNVEHHDDMRPGRRVEVDAPPRDDEPHEDERDWPVEAVATTVAYEANEPALWDALSADLADLRNRINELADTPVAAMSAGRPGMVDSWSFDALVGRVERIETHLRMRLG